MGTSTAAGHAATPPLRSQSAPDPTRVHSRPSRTPARSAPAEKPIRAASAAAAGIPLVRVVSQACTTTRARTL